MVESDVAEGMVKVKDLPTTGTVSVAHRQAIVESSLSIQNVNRDELTGSHKIEIEWSDRCILKEWELQVQASKQSSAAAPVPLTLTWRSLYHSRAKRRSQLASTSRSVAELTVYKVMHIQRE